MFWKKKKKEKALVISQENFNIVIGNNNLVFVFFTAPWCGACKILTPLIHELAEENKDKNVVITTVHTDNEKELAQKFNIRSIPSLYVFHDQNIVYSGTGMISKPRLQEMIDSMLLNNKTTEQK